MASTAAPVEFSPPKIQLEQPAVMGMDGNGALDQPSAPSPEEQLSERLFGVLGGAMTANLVALGDRLGIYKHLKALGKVTSQELAEAAGLHERFVREWLHQQACAGTIMTDDDAAKFWMSDAQLNVLVNEHGDDASPFYLGGFFAMVPNLLANTKRLDTAFQTGVGYDYDMMPAAEICSVCRALGVWTRHCLVGGMCSLPGIKEKLEAGITIADIGCGSGELVFTVAKAFPKTKIHGYDISVKSLEVCKERQREPQHEGLDIEFRNPEQGEGLPAEPTYDLIITMDAVHDMAFPGRVLELVRQALKPDGSYIINDPRGLPTPAENIKNNMGPSTMLYGISCHSCLPSGMSKPGGRGFGTLGFQEAQARELAAAAGFTGFEVIDTFNSPMNNVFRLSP